MADHARIQLADYLQAAEIETHIVVQEEDSVRADWWRASCALHDWYVTGSRPNVEDAAAHHVAWDHPACAHADPDSPAAAPLHCRLLPDHGDDHYNGGRTWTNDREPTATAGRSGRSASHCFATDRDRESFLGIFSGQLDTWFTPEFAAYVRSGRPAHIRRIPDVGCPKCGHDVISMQHCFGGEGSFMPDDRCRLGDPEHFHRRCSRCSYRWRTNETLLNIVKEGEL